MEEEQERLSIVNMKDGGLVEQIDRAIAAVLENVQDVNTTEKPREINVKIVIAPSKDRTLLEFGFEVNSKLAGMGKYTFTADLDTDERGRPVAIERGRQKKLPFEVKEVTQL